jgi:uncharacterized membrane protein YdjX (TVP38/TMEM64 family)
VKSPKKTPTKSTIQKSKASIILGLISLGFMILTAVGLLMSWEYIKEPQLLRDKIGDHYFVGAILMVLITAVQVVVALLPGEFVEVAAGYCFGGWMGALLCTTGILLGSCITILLVRKFGSRLVYALYPKEKIDRLPIINDPPKRDMLTFILFVIPGMPKDLFTYAVGLTNMSIPRYILLTTLARFPSVILSTLSGDSAAEQDYTKTVIFVIITAVVSGIGVLAYNIFVTIRNRRRGIK